MFIISPFVYNVAEIAAIIEPASVDTEEMIQEEKEERQVGNELIYASQLEELKKEFAIKENEMKKQLEDNKNKCRSKIKSLQKQLAEAASSLVAKDEAEKLAKKLKLNLKEVNEDRSKAISHTDTLKEKITVMEEENNSLSEKLQLKEEETNRLTEELAELMLKQKELSLWQISPAPEVLSLQSSAVVQSQVEIPVRPESAVMMSESVLPLVTTEPALDELPDMPPSLEQSIISMDPAPLGSPLGSSTNDRDSMGPNSHHPVPYGLSMLAGSRLSHYSSAPQVCQVILAYLLVLSYCYCVHLEWIHLSWTSHNGRMGQSV